MKADSATLQEILHSPNQYIIPIFQRYYSWGKEEWERLWGDLNELHEQKKQNHFMGSLIFVPEKMSPVKGTTFQVIDGQQRLITLSLLLCALRDMAVLRGYPNLSEEITENYLIHKFKEGRDHYRIYPKQRDREQYMSAIARKNPSDNQWC